MTCPDSKLEVALTVIADVRSSAAVVTEGSTDLEGRCGLRVSKGVCRHGCNDSSVTWESKSKEGSAE
jgi:hypothetical protein